MQETPAPVQTQQNSGQSNGQTPIQTEIKELTPEGQQVATMLAMVQDNPKLAEDPVVKNFLNKIGEFQKTNKVTKTENKPEEPPKPNEPEKPETLEKPSIFFTKQSKNGTPKIDNLTDLIKYTKEKYSIEDPSTLLNSVDIWRNDAQKKTEFEKAKTDYDTLFENLPDPVFNAIQTWANGGDWLNMLRQISKIDYSKPFEKFNRAEILNHYFPGKFDEKDIDEKAKYEDLDPVMKQALNVAKDKFDFEAKQVEAGRENIRKNAQAKLDNLKNSATLSVQKLQQLFPDMDKRQVSDIQKRLAGGDIDSLFFKDDNTYKDTAAEMVALLLHGKEEIMRLKERNEELEKQLEETVSRKSDRPNFRPGTQMAAPGEELVKTFKDLVPKQRYS